MDCKKDTVYLVGKPNIRYSKNLSNCNGESMDNRQAIKILKTEKSWESDERIKTAFDLAIQALEKQVPKKVEIKHWSPAHCPTCGHTLSESQGDGYYSHPTFLERCPNVGCCQRLKW